MHLYAALNCSLQPTGSSYSCHRFMRLAVADKWVQFRDPRFNRSGEIRPKAVGGGIFVCFLSNDKCRPEVAGDVIFGAAMDQVFADVSV